MVWIGLMEKWLLHFIIKMKNYTYIYIKTIFIACLKIISVLDTQDQKV